MELITKNWFQRLTESFRKPKHFETLRFYIPPELVEKILSCINDQNTLLRCRLVCSQWKHIANKLLEDQCLSYWTDWNFALHLKFPSFSPPIFVYREDSEKQWSHLTVVLPSFLTTNYVNNPFPQNSLAIIGFQESHKYDNNMSCPRAQFKSKVKLVTVLENLSHFLTSLILHDVLITFCDLAELFYNVPNLKAISFSSVQFYLQQPKENNIDIVAPLNLTHIEILNCGEELTEFIIPLLSHQLISLKIGGLNYEGSLAIGNSVNLRRLFIHEIDAMEFEELINDAGIIPPLEFLSIIMSSQNPFWQEKQKILNCISKISPSLTHLRLKVEVKVLQKLLKEYNVVFPNVICLEILCSSSGIEEKSLKRNILSWFPKLKSVAFKSIPKVAFLNERECLLCGEIGPEFNPGQ